MMDREGKSRTSSGGGRVAADASREGSGGGGENVNCMRCNICRKDFVGPVSVALCRFGCEDHASHVCHFDCVEVYQISCSTKSVKCPAESCTKEIPNKRPPSDYSFFIGEIQPASFEFTDSPDDPMKSWDILRDFLFDFGHQYKQNINPDGSGEVTPHTIDELPIIAWHVARLMNSIQSDYTTARSAVDVHSRMIAEAILLYLQMLLTGKKCNNLDSLGTRLGYIQQYMINYGEILSEEKAVLINILVNIIDGDDSYLLGRISTIVNSQIANNRHYSPDNYFVEVDDSSHSESHRSNNIKSGCELIYLVYKAAYVLRKLLEIDYYSPLIVRNDNHIRWERADSLTALRSKERDERRSVDKRDRVELLRPPSNKKFLRSNGISIYGFDDEFDKKWYDLRDCLYNRGKIWKRLPEALMSSKLLHIEFDIAVLMNYVQDDFASKSATNIAVRCGAIIEATLLHLSLDPWRHDQDKEDIKNICACLPLDKYLKQLQFVPGFGPEVSNDMQVLIKGTLDIIDKFHKVIEKTKFSESKVALSLPAVSSLASSSSLSVVTSAVSPSSSSSIVLTSSTSTISSSQLDERDEGMLGVAVQDNSDVYTLVGEKSIFLNCCLCSKSLSNGALCTFGCSVCSNVCHVDCLESKKMYDGSIVTCPICDTPRNRLRRPPSDSSFFDLDTKPLPFEAKDEIAGDYMLSWDTLRNFLFDFGHQYKDGRCANDDTFDPRSDFARPIIAWHVARLMNSIQSDYTTARSAVDVHSRMIAEAIDCCYTSGETTTRVSASSSTAALAGTEIANSPRFSTNLTENLKSLLVTMVPDISVPAGNKFYSISIDKSVECKLINAVYDAASSLKKRLEKDYSKYTKREGGEEIIGGDHAAKWTTASEGQKVNLEERLVRKRADKIDRFELKRPPSIKSFFASSFGAPLGFDNMDVWQSIRDSLYLFGKKWKKIGLGSIEDKRRYRVYFDIAVLMNSIQDEFANKSVSNVAFRCGTVMDAILFYLDNYKFARKCHHHCSHSERLTELRRENKARLYNNENILFKNVDALDYLRDKSVSLSHFILGLEKPEDLQKLVDHVFVVLHEFYLMIKLDEGHRADFPRLLSRQNIHEWKELVEIKIVVDDQDDLCNVVEFSKAAFKAHFGSRYLNLSVLIDYFKSISVDVVDIIKIFGEFFLGEVHVPVVEDCEGLDIERTLNKYFEHRYIGLPELEIILKGFQPNPNPNNFLEIYSDLNKFVDDHFNTDHYKPGSTCQCYCCPGSSQIEPFNNTWIASCDDKIVGCIMVSNCVRPDSKMSGWEVQRLFIHADHRGTGLSHRLLNEAIKYVDKRGGDFWVGIFEDNVLALSLYSYFGFVVVPDFTYNVTVGKKIDKKIVMSRSSSHARHGVPVKVGGRSASGGEDDAIGAVGDKGGNIASNNKLIWRKIDFSDIIRSNSSNPNHFLKYEGNFDLNTNSMEGYGRVTVQSGDIFEGNFVNNSLEGCGFVFFMPAASPASGIYQQIIDHDRDLFLKGCRYKGLPCEFVNSNLVKDPRSTRSIFKVHKTYWAGFKDFPFYLYPDAETNPENVQKIKKIFSSTEDSDVLSFYRYEVMSTFFCGVIHKNTRVEGRIKVNDENGSRVIKWLPGKVIGPDPYLNHSSNPDKYKVIFGDNDAEYLEYTLSKANIRFVNIFVQYDTFESRRRALERLCAVYGNISSVSKDEYEAPNQIGKSVMFHFNKSFDCWKNADKKTAFKNQIMADILTPIGSDDMSKVTIDHINQEKMSSKVILSSKGQAEKCIGICNCLKSIVKLKIQDSGVDESPDRVSSVCSHRNRLERNCCHFTFNCSPSCPKKSFPCIACHTCKTVDDVMLALVSVDCNRCGYRINCNRSNVTYCNHCSVKIEYGFTPLPTRVARTVVSIDK